ncbi:MAG: HAD family hydrolase [Armatimonadetes bacterium]|nr:HAD family hydrolase [Armatimonadota bacterium]
MPFARPFSCSCRGWYNPDMHVIFEQAEAVLFDLDGTLVETGIDFSRLRDATLQLVAEYGIDARPLQDLDALSIVERAVDALRLRGEAEAGETLRKRAFARLQAMEMAYCASPRPVPGMYDLLEVLRAQDTRIGIITRNDREVALRTLSTLQIPHDLLVSRDDVDKVKPHPQHVMVALEEWRVAPPQCVVVGDYWMDVEAGRAAGCRTVGIWRLDVPINPFRHHPPDVLVRELRELL